MTTRSEASDLVPLITAACCAVGAGGGIGSIRVVADRRLTYDELARLREHAAACNVALTMDGTGLVTVRRAVVSPAPGPEARAKRRPS